jgi:hypothetical protein
MTKQNGRAEGSAQVEAAVVDQAETTALMSEVERQAVWQMEFLQERIAELEFALEDSGWSRISGETARELSRNALTRIAQHARMAFLKNPLINRAVSLQAFYVWGQGVNVRAAAAPVNDVVQAFLDDRKNQSELTSHQARTLKEIDLQLEGNLFFVYFTNPSSGRVRVRTLPAEEVVEIVCDPDDAKSPWYYKRVWTERRLDQATGVTTLLSRTAWYPDWRAHPPEKPQTIGGAPVQWETPIQHVRVGGTSDMRFGVPEVYAALDWARAYKSFLEDVATIMRALSRFAGKVSTPGGKKGVAAAKSKLQTTSSLSNLETNPPPTVGSVFVGSEGTDFTPMQVRGASISPEDGRRFLLMVAAAVGMPETFFGDVSVGTLATAKSLDRPTELKFRDRQTLWADVLKDMLDYVVDWAARAPSGPLQGTAALDPDGEMVVTLAIDPETSEPMSRQVDVTFPAILEHDVGATVGSIVQAATLDGHPLGGVLDAKLVAKLLLTALGEDDVDEILDELFPEGEEDSAPHTPPPGQGAPADQPAAEAAMLEAVRELRTAVSRLQATGG